MTNDLREPYLLLPEQAESLHQPIDWQDFMDRWKTNIIQPLAQAFQAIAEAMKPAFEATMKVAQAVNDVIYNAYLEDGAIYGKSHDGMMRWMKERGEIARLRQQAEHLEQHQEMIRDFKQMLAEKRGEQARQ